MKKPNAYRDAERTKREWNPPMSDLPPTRPLSPGLLLTLILCAIGVAACVAACVGIWMGAL